MKLSHFSKDPFVLDPDFQYTYDEFDRFKPSGLWLSDESDYGWMKWCESEGFRPSHLKHQASFFVNTESCILLNGYDEIKKFSSKYRINNSSFKNFEISYIDWDNVIKEYSGIIITPYCWDARLEFIWYYGWDCASACIWDLTSIKVL